MEATDTVEIQRLSVVLFAVGVGIFASLVAFRLGFFKMPKMPPLFRSAVHWYHVAMAFAIFLVVEILVVPTLYGAWIAWEQRGIENPPPLILSAEQKGWLNLVSVLLTALCLLVYLYSRKVETRQQVLGYRGFHAGFLANFKSYLFGSVSWLVIYPWIVALGQLIAIVISWLYEGPGVDQVAVKHLKDIISAPVLFVITALAVVTVIPFVEELLFRGFLQNWLKGLFGQWPAILTTSVIFAMFHFSTSQGIENIELIASLFILACFLGYLRERKESLWASFGLHSTFNFISIMMLLSEAGN